MTQKEFRWLLLALASGLLAFVVVRQRKQLAAALPQPLLEQAERFVIPWSTLDRSGAPVSDSTVASDAAGPAFDEAEEREDVESMRRKVSSTHRISFLGKRYGPLPEALVGQYVEIEANNSKLFILHDGTPIATFDLQS